MNMLLALASCMGEEQYSVSVHDTMVFSADTVAFDTVIAGQSTNTYTFQLFNRGEKALRIQKANLGLGQASPFVANVDGLWLSDGEGGPFTIYGKDSLRVFVKLNAPLTDLDEPQYLEDFLEFSLESGVKQKVILTASSQDVNILTGEVCSGLTVLDSPRPYQIFDSLVVERGAVLQLIPGARLYFHADASLIVHGTLVAQGTAEKPIVMRGDRLGYMFSNQPYDRIPGQWGGVVFTAESYDNDMTWCDVHSGKFGIQCDSSDVQQSKLVIDNSIIYNTMGHAFFAKNCRTFVGNCQITNAGGNCVTLLGGDHTFVHCTIGEFYPFTGGRGVALNVTNFEGTTPLPLARCQFINSIITGYADDDIMGEAATDFEDCAFNYIFKNCLLNTPRVENEALVDCIFEEDCENKDLRKAGNFYPAFDNVQLIYPFTLSPHSSAVGKADAALTQQSGYIFDLRGKSRLEDDAPDIGAYEAQLEEEQK